MMHVNVSASKPEINVSFNNVSDVTVVTTESSLVWKMSLFHFEEIFRAAIAREDVHVFDRDMQVVSRPCEHSPLAVLLRGVTEGEIF